jgi:hypothetical protein
MKQFLTAFLGLSIILGFLFAAIFLPIDQSREAFDQLLPNYVDSKIEVRLEKTNLWNNLFRDQVEHLYILYLDGTLYHATSNEDIRIAVDRYALMEALKRDNHPIKDAIIIIHNHWSYPRFSPTDISAYYTFAQAGFQGHFLLFIQPVREVLEFKK